MTIFYIYYFRYGFYFIFEIIFNHTSLYLNNIYKFILCEIFIKILKVKTLYLLYVYLNSNYYSKWQSVNHMNKVFLAIYPYKDNKHYIFCLFFRGNSRIKVCSLNIFLIDCFELLFRKNYFENIFYSNEDICFSGGLYNIISAINIFFRRKIFFYYEDLDIYYSKDIIYLILTLFFITNICILYLRAASK